MESGTVVKALDLVEGRGGGIGTGRKPAGPHDIVLQSALGRLRAVVIVAVPLAAHRVYEAMIG